MKTLNVRNMSKASQKGFTIIELVVVILLLGILTATALPRFMSVTDEAHGAVRDAVQAGLASANAMYYAEFIAQGGTSTTIGGYSTVTASATTGYPNLTTAASCVTAYNGLLQAGAPTVVASANSPFANAAALDDDESAATTDFSAGYMTDSGSCAYIYLADTADRTDTSGRTYVLLSPLGVVTQAVIP